MKPRRNLLAFLGVVKKIINTPSAGQMHASDVKRNFQRRTKEVVEGRDFTATMS